MTKTEAEIREDANVEQTARRSLARSIHAFGYTFVTPENVTNDYMTARIAKDQIVEAIDAFKRTRWRTVALEKLLAECEATIQKGP